MDGITYLLPNFNGAIVEIREWMSDFIPHLEEYMITYLMFVKGDNDVFIVVVTLFTVLSEVTITKWLVTKQKLINATGWWLILN